MPRFTLPTVALCSLFSLAALTSAQAPATAPTPEALAAMKARLAQLKDETAALEAKIAAAEAPAPGTEPGLVTALNALPKNLWPGDSDTDMKQSLREKWLADNIKLGTSFTFTGTVSVVSPTTVYTPDKKPVDAVTVVLDGGKHMVWGKEKTLRISAPVENVAPQDTLDWGDKKTITITGPLNDVRPTSSPVDIRLTASKAK